MFAPETIDWLDVAQQKIWFDKFKTKGDQVGLKFDKFQEFLNLTLYVYFRNLAENSNELKNASSNKDIKEQFKFTYQQEMKLFKAFDQKNDQVIDSDEFSRLCQNWLHKTFHRSNALVVVDVQNDFIDGSLALINGPAQQDGADVVPVINDLLNKCKFQAVVYTQDWHPIDHIAFHENLHLRKYYLKGEQNSDTNNEENNSDNKNNRATGNQQKIRDFRLRKLNPKVNLYDTVLFDEGRMEQKMWPVHCVQDSWGAELHPKLKIMPDAVKIFKGTLSHVDAYSAFWDNMHLNETSLRQELINRKIDDVFFCGLALDYCVSASAIDSAKAGFVTFVVEDACKGIAYDQMDKCRSDMMENGILMINSNSVDNYCSNPQIIMSISYKIGMAMSG